VLRQTLACSMNKALFSKARSDPSVPARLSLRILHYSIIFMAPSPLPLSGNTLRKYLGM
jgi:hypothetical protein